MIIDRYTKAVLTLIAISLFVISLNPWVVPTKAYAELDRHDISLIETNLTAIRHKVTVISSSIGGYLSNIADGRCRNPKLC